MKTDDRDERLAALLDDAVAGVDPGIDRRLREVRRRGTRRRFVELASVLSVVAVLVGAVAVTAVSRRSNHEPSHERTTWTAVGGPEAGWRIRYPSTWHLTETDDSGCAGTPVRRGAFISNLPFDWHHPDGTATGTCNGGRWVFAGFPSDGIALEIEPVGHMHGIFPPQPDTAFPIHKGDLDRGHGIRGGPAHWYETVWRNGVWLMNVRLYVGVDVTSADRGASERTLESLRLDLPPAKPSRPAVPTTCGTPPQAVGRVGEPLRGDVDGDGSSDRVMLLRKGQPKGACRFVVEAITGSGRSAVSAQVDQSEPDPFLLGLAALRSEPGLQVVVKVDSGAAYYLLLPRLHVGSGIRGARSSDHPAAHGPLVGSAGFGLEPRNRRYGCLVSGRERGRDHGGKAGRDSPDRHEVLSTGGKHARSGSLPHAALSRSRSRDHAPIPASDRLPPGLRRMLGGRIDRLSP